MLRIKNLAIMVVIAGLLVSTVPTVASAKANKVFEHYKQVLSQFQKQVIFKGKYSTIVIRVTYYSARLIDAIVDWEAEKHLWTQDEAENYKYQLLKTLHFDDMLPFKIEINNMGPSMHPAPFGSKVTLWLGTRAYKPAKYDLRFNFKIVGKRAGMVFFRRRDKNGKEIITPKTSLMILEIDSSISPVTAGKGFDFKFKWQDPYENLSILAKGDIARARLEMDRLTRRIRLLMDKKKELLKKIKEIEEEIKKIKSRIEQLESVK